MLKHDQRVIDGIIDRCAAGGSDNRRGQNMDTTKAQRQFDSFLDHLKLEEGPERAELEAYFHEQVANA